MARRVLSAECMKTVALATLVLGSLTLAPGLAGADQCAYVVPGQAQDAVQLLEVGKDIIQFCEPCGDTAPALVHVESFTAAETGFEGTWEVSVNGAGIDLAYTFIDNGDGRWINLAEMVDCETDGVSCMLGADLFASTYGELWCLDARAGTVRWHDALRGLGLGLVCVGSTSVASLGNQLEEERREQARKAAAAT